MCKEPEPPEAAFFCLEPEPAQVGLSSFSGFFEFLVFFCVIFGVFIGFICLLVFFVSFNKN